MDALGDVRSPHRGCPLRGAGASLADVLNDEKTRKWIQSLKRIMTYCQNKYLPDDLSKMVGYVKN